MQSESARMTTAKEAAFRVQYPNSRPRAIKVISLDPPSARIVMDLARQTWNGAHFFTSVSFSTERSPGDAHGTTMHAWLGDLAGRAIELTDEISTADFVVVIASAGADSQAVSVIADACAVHSKTLLALLVPRPRQTDEDVSRSLSYLRPYAKMLVVAGDAEYCASMLTALRA
jgi:hypothetical protein